MSHHRRGSQGVINWDALPDPGPRYQLGDRLGSGVSGDVYEATDLQSNNHRVAIKIQRISEDTIEDLEEEYRVLKKLSEHHNLPDFYGIFRKKGRSDSDQLWLVMELCEGGSVSDLVRGLEKNGKKLNEDQIAYILKETIKAAMHLHEHHVMHRDIRGSNILLTKNGEVKLVDFGLSRELHSTMGKRGTSTGSPCWMAPEVVTAEQRGGSSAQDAYDNRIDVWAIGITAIELADVKAPFEDIHPTRALFQIVRNPPPGLYRPANWTQVFNDFIAECLEKNPDNRPFMVEMVEHPFITKLPENDHHLTHELKALVESVKNHKLERKQEVCVRTNFLKTDQTTEPEAMFLEDLAALDHVTEDVILEQLQQRLKKGSCYSFLGDVLLFLNPNEQQPIYTEEIHTKYCFKSRSENTPHIYSVADCAYQDVLHHEEPQHIILSGESLSGKTSNMLHAMRHLLHLGKGNIATANRIMNAVTILHALGNACTPLNANSTRHVLHTQMTFTNTGKISGAIFWLYQLERWRVTSEDRRQGNFHFFYYFYDSAANANELDKYHLEAGRRHRFLRSVAAPSGGGSPGGSLGVSSDPASAAANNRQFDAVKTAMRALELGDENIETMKRVMAAILLLGEVRFRDGGEGHAEVENPRIAAHVAEMLEVEEKKFAWALINYCVIEKGSASRRRHSTEEAEEARDALARAIYSRLVDWIVNSINLKLSFTRAVFGDRHCISLLDLFGFECFQKNGLEQLLVNSLNEQLQYHYTQRLFAWEMQERDEEEVRTADALNFYDNRPAVDLLMAKPDGVLWLIDEATRTSQHGDFILASLKRSGKTPHLQLTQGNEFSVAHYTGKVTYDAKELPEKNRDFVPPEVTETLRLSGNSLVRALFTNPLSRTGNLTQAQLDISSASDAAPEETKSDGEPRKKSKWGAALIADKQRGKQRGYNTMSRGQFSQTRRMRTATATFRATCLEVLRTLNTGGTHFVRCLRAELTGQPRGFQLEVVRQQLRALAVVDTVKARQTGYPCRVPFSEFLRRYKFLAFDFDETVDETSDNCRLLMVRLKMEGMALGRSKVFLKYYNEEYLARLYEVQVKKIIKVQAMMRAFLAKKKVDGGKAMGPGSLAVAPSGAKGKKTSAGASSASKSSPKTAKNMTQDEAALTIQTQFRGYQARKQYGPKLNKPQNVKGSKAYDKTTAAMMRYYCHRWRRSSMFQVLLQYRAAKQHDLVYFAQQAHLYNQGIMVELQESQKQNISMNRVREVERHNAGKYLGDKPTHVWKLPFRLDHKSPFLDTSMMCDPVDAGMDATYSNSHVHPNDHDTWDAPLRRKKSLLRKRKNQRDQEVQTTNVNPPNVCYGTAPGPAIDVASTIHIQTPFRRELLDTSPAMPRKANARRSAPTPTSERMVPASPKGPAPIRPGGKSSAPAPPLVQQQSWMDKSGDNRRPAPAPRRSDMDNNNSRDFNFPNETTNGRGAGGRPNSHILELEKRGRAINDGAEEDAPFNFQAMLRKTNKARSSMKRNSIYEPEDDNDEQSSRYSGNGSGVPAYKGTSAYGGGAAGGGGGVPAYKGISAYGAGGGAAQRGGQKVMWDKNEPEPWQQDGAARSNNKPAASYSYSAAVKGGGAQSGGGGWESKQDKSSGWESNQDHKDWGSNNKSKGEEDDYRHEIAPGIVVEGDVADL